MDNRRGRCGRNDEHQNVPIELITITLDPINVSQDPINVDPATAPAQYKTDDLSFLSEYMGTDLLNAGEDIVMTGGPLAKGDFVRNSFVSIYFHFELFLPTNTHPLTYMFSPSL